MPGTVGTPSTLERLKEACLFFLRFCVEPQGMGTPLPTSRRVADTIARELSEHVAETVVEVGTGSGSLTRGILEAVDDGRRVLCIEKNTAFREGLERRFGNRVHVVCADALKLPSLIDDTDWEQPDAIVSSVPLVIPRGEEFCRTMADVLGPGGLCLQLANYPVPLRAHFQIKKSYSFPTNIPPERLHRAIPGSIDTKNREERSPDR